MLNKEYIKKNIYSLLETNIKDISTHIIVIKEDSVFSAISIEFGEIGQGSTIGASLNSLKKVILAKIKFYAKNNNIENIFENEFTSLWSLYIYYNKMVKNIYIAEKKGIKFNFEKFFEKNKPISIINKKDMEELSVKLFKSGFTYGFLIGNKYSKINYK